jgi:hypothetical protein
LALTHPGGNWPHTTAIDQPTRVLLALSQAGDELEAAAAEAAALSPTQAQQLLTLLGRQRLGPWVSHQLEQTGWLVTLPEVLQSPLRQATARAKQRSARQRLALLHTVRCLQAHGIAAVALKGAHLAWQHYPQPWLRPMRDLDLLLPEEQIVPAFALLERQGFRVQGASVRRPDDPLMWRVNDFSLWHPSGAFIELHRSLWYRPGDILHGDFSLEPAFWAQEPPYRLPPDPQGLSHLQPTYLTLHCLVHHLMRANLNMGPLGLVDLELLQAAGHLDTPELAAAAERLGFASLLATAHTVLAGWRHTRWLTAATVPSWVLPLMMSREQKLVIYLDDRSIRSHARQWLAIQARGGRWGGPAPSRTGQLLHLARAITLLPAMVVKAGVVRQIRRRLGQHPMAPPDGQLPPELVAATRQLQARTRGHIAPCGA